MKHVIDKIQYIMERYINELDDVPSDEDMQKRQIKIFYDDLDMTGKQKILEAIDATYEYVEVFTDDIVRQNIEEALGKMPICVMTAEELINTTGIDL